MPTAVGVPKVVVASDWKYDSEVPCGKVLPAVTDAAVRSTVPGAQTAAGLVMDKLGLGLMVAVTAAVSKQPSVVAATMK